MEPETALGLVQNGATLLLLDVPQFTLIGIDTLMFSVGPVFKGIKMIPPGPHFVYYSSSNRDGSKFSPIVGFFIDTCPSEEERYCQSVKSLEFDRELGPYTLSQYGDWKRLSNYITKTTIERIALDQQLRNSKFSKSADKSQKRGCYYTSIPRVIKRKGIHGQELTSLNLDKTQLLESILMKDYGGSEDLLLGELQFAFIAFLMGQSLEGFLQWKSLVSLLFGCNEAPFHTRSLLFTKFIRVIYYQLKFGFQKDQTGSSNVEKESSLLLDESWLSADSFLHHLCKDFFSLVQEASVVDGDLLSWTRKLRDLLENTLGWDFQQTSTVDGLYCEEDEFAPVVEMLEDPSEQ
ncbi:hypothetical protein AAG906_038471 [Vitis piasezkii]